MNRTEFMRQLESLLQNISIQSGKKRYNIIMNILTMRDRRMNRDVIEALGNPMKVAENIKKTFSGMVMERIAARKINAETKAMILHPAYSNEEDGGTEQRSWQSDASQTAQAQVVSPQNKEGMSTGMIVLIVIYVFWHPR